MNQISQEAAQELLHVCRELHDAVFHCASIVGDSMYAKIKRDYRNSLAELANKASAAIAKATGSAT